MPNLTPNIIFGSKDEEKLFIENLDRSFCAVSHLNERLIDVAEIEDFKRLGPQLAKSMKFAEEKCRIYDHIYELLGKTPDFKKCTLLIGLLEEIFDQIRIGDKTSGIRELLTINYFDFINYTTGSSFAILKFLTKSILHPALQTLITKLDTTFVINFPDNS